MKHLTSFLQSSSFAFIYPQLSGFFGMFNEKALPKRRQECCAEGRALLGSVPACAMISCKR